MQEGFLFFDFHPGDGAVHQQVFLPLIFARQGEVFDLVFELLFQPPDFQCVKHAASISTLWPVRRDRVRIRVKHASSDRVSATI